MSAPVYVLFSPEDNGFLAQPEYRTNGCTTTSLYEAKMFRVHKDAWLTKLDLGDQGQRFVVQAINVVPTQG